MNYKIAVIVPTGRLDYITGTILDGLIQLKKENPELEFCINETDADWRNFSVKDYVLPNKKFIEFAGSADFIILNGGKDGTNYKLAEEINRWNITVFVEGSEVGKNRRYDFMVQNEVLAGKYMGYGAIDKDMLKKCALYFRREKPYLDGIIPFPFGIESIYTKYYVPGADKDIDFICVFGQDEFPLMRKYAKEILKEFCQKNNFTCFTDKTKTTEEFYKLLARSKVGISVGGGGFDTARFWEILGNNCLLLTERIDIYQPDSIELNYKRIWQFNNLFDFEYQLYKIGNFLQKNYPPEYLDNEYKEILLKHSGRGRVLTIINEAINKGLIK